MCGDFFLVTVIASHLEGLKDMPHVFSHSSNTLRSVWSWWLSSSFLSIVLYTIVQSANYLAVDSMHSGISSTENTYLFFKGIMIMSWEPFTWFSKQGALWLGSAHYDLAVYSFIFAEHFMAHSGALWLCRSHYDQTERFMDQPRALCFNMAKQGALWLRGRGAHYNDDNDSLKCFIYFSSSPHCSLARLVCCSSCLTQCRFKIPDFPIVAY